MSEIRDEIKFIELVGLIKHLNSMATCWVTGYFIIQGGILTIEAALVSRGTPAGNPLLLIFLILALAIFAVSCSEAITRILVRNRFWLRHYISEAIRIEGKNGIWLENFSPPGRSLDQQFIFLNNCVVVGWILFLFIFLYSGIRALL
ncbi:MAG TPA: hypothetical protein PLT76_07115 [Candidatus Omnitrophota bacterium]|nr:hypothetical protein [Candidatus Omnitrophota bacterium]HPB68248.1 hypothetical protein [Candidatus Omnitrophota bacterium]HQO58476.1 hypothetical protein [Candidatus Omnitrophota bacterium]HQP12877.1 hypothetical protein [Candidatus Omnitrophota bacterium]